MSTSENIINVTEDDFDFEVLSYSQKAPVVVDFWATWCKPCKSLSPILEKLAEEAKGAFRLAKVDVDENPNLARRYNVYSIPTVKAFRNGQVIAEFVGVLPEPSVREFISKLEPSPSDLALEKADSLFSLRQWVSAETAYRKVLEQTPGRPAGLLGLAKSLLAQGRGTEAEEILHRFPASKEYNRAEILLPLAEAFNTLKHGSLSEDDPLAPAYQNALRLAARANFPSALDGLLDILRQDKRYMNDEARKVYIALLEMLGADDPQTREYRNELASILF